MWCNTGESRVKDQETAGVEVTSGKALFSVPKTAGSPTVTPYSPATADAALQECLTQGGSLETRVSRIWLWMLFWILYIGFL